MVLSVLDYCDAVWHECGQGNSDKIERLQRQAARIVYFKAASKLSTDEIMTQLGLLMSALQIEFPDTFLVISM